MSRFYATAHGARPDAGGDTITVRAADSKVLSVHPASAKVADCGVAPKTGDKKVIVVSQAFTR